MFAKRTDGPPQSKEPVFAVVVAVVVAVAVVGVVVLRPKRKARRPRLLLAHRFNGGNPDPKILQPEAKPRPCCSYQQR
jgi:hypothetical protein